MAMYAYGDWRISNNWSGGRVPTIDDDVVIHLMTSGSDNGGNNISIVDSREVKSLLLSRTRIDNSLSDEVGLSLVGSGELKIHDNSKIDKIHLFNGTLVAKGENTRVEVGERFHLFEKGGNLEAQDGAELVLQGAADGSSQLYNASHGLYELSSISAIGLGSTIDMRHVLGLNNIELFFEETAHLTINSIDGGYVNFSSLMDIGSATVNSEGSNSFIDMSSLHTIFTDESLSFNATDGGEIDLTSLSSINNKATEGSVSFNSDGLGSLISIGDLCAVNDAVVSFNETTMGVVNYSRLNQPERGLENSIYLVERVSANSREYNQGGFLRNYSRLYSFYSDGNCYSEVGPVFRDEVNRYVDGLAADLGSGLVGFELETANNGETVTNSQLVSINPLTGMASAIGEPFTGREIRAATFLGKNLLAIDVLSNTVLKINPVSGQILREIELDGSISKGTDLAASLAGDLILLNNQLSISTIYRLDPITGSITKDFSVPKFYDLNKFNGIAFGLNGSELEMPLFLLGYSGYDTSTLPDLNEGFSLRGLGVSFSGVTSHKFVNQADVNNADEIWLELIHDDSEFKFELSTLLQYTEETLFGDLASAIEFEKDAPGEVGFEIESILSDGSVELSWLNYNEQENGDDISHYLIYGSESDFSSVVGVEVYGITLAGEQQKLITKFTEKTEFYMAVVAVDEFSNQLQEINSKFIRIDHEGPEISNVRYQGIELINGLLVETGGELQIESSDISQVSRVEFLLAVDTLESLVGEGSGDGPIYSTFFDLLDFEDGEYDLIIRSFDGLGNSSEVSFAITVALSPPMSILIESPVNGLKTNVPEIAISGLINTDSRVSVFVNNTLKSSDIRTDLHGRFLATITLDEGENIIYAVADNRAGDSLSSGSIAVTLDTSPPKPPTSLTAKAEPNGEIKLSWTASESVSIVSYEIYRSDVTFETEAESVLIQSVSSNVNSYVEMVDSDGSHFYRVRSVNDLGEKSQFSEIAFAVSDSRAPTASISYVTDGLYDETTETFGLGLVTITLTVSEELLVDPFLTFASEGGVPLSVSLAKV